ncbi:unnamed protein product [Rhizophagus irregularis]|nr:unnamed protein product [Rhizophagus irregularis]
MEALNELITFEEWMHTLRQLSLALWPFTFKLGDAISPKIFCSRTHISVRWPHDVTDKTTWESFSEFVPMLAYMNDTCFIDSSKERIQNNIDLANEFYKLHDIHINGSKSELIVLNPSNITEEQYVEMGREKIKSKPQTPRSDIWDMDIAQT